MVKSESYFFSPVTNEFHIKFPVNYLQVVPPLDQAGAIAFRGTESNVWWTSKSASFSATAHLTFMLYGQLSLLGTTELKSFWGLKAQKYF